MSKKQFDTNLKFGHAILIQGYRNQGEGNQKQYGFITAKGYADIKAKYETCKDILFFQNYRDAIFQIIPAGNFQINDQLLKSNDKNDSLLERAENQKKQFQMNLEKKKKGDIFFGSQVMFRHLDSDTYLTGTINPSEGDNGAFAVEVTKKLSSNLVFKLLPVRSFEFDGMKILFQSPVKIKNVRNETYLTFQKIGRENEVRRLNQNPVQSKESFRIPVKVKSKDSTIHSCVSYSTDLSRLQQTPTPWKFKLHMVNIINDKLIQHDIGYFQHTQNQGVLTAFKNQIALKESKNPTGQLQFYDCLWQIEKHQPANQDAYIIRHLMSGMIFKIQQNKPMLDQIASGKPQIGWIEMKVAKKQSEQIASDSLIQLVRNGDFLDISDEIKGQELSQSEQISSSYQIVNNKFNKNVIQKLNYVRKDLKLSKQVPIHCFKIMQINQQTKQQVLFALSFHQTLINLIEDLKWGPVWAQRKIKYYRMIGISKSLKQIQAFLKKCDQQQAQKEQIRPLQKRQQICKDLGMSQLLFELLYYMKINKKDKIFENSLNQLQKFQQLYEICYQVIVIMIKDHYLFKIHVSKWIDFIFQDVKENDQKGRLKALKQILKDNTYLINFIAEESNEIISEICRCELSSHKQKYLEILRLLCIVDKKPIQKNQKKILQQFVKNTDINLKVYEQKFILGKSRVRSEKEIKNNFQFEQDEITQINFIKDTSDQKNQDFYNQYFHLLADLCYGRNKITQNYLKNHYPLEVLLQFLKNQHISTTYTPLLRLINHLYVEDPLYYPIIRINHIYDIKKVEYHLPINICQATTKPWEIENLRALKQQLIQQLKNNIQQSKKQYQKIFNSIIQEKEKQYTIWMNMLTKLQTILQTLLTAIQLGFWKDLDQMKQVILILQKLLINDHELINSMIEKKRSEHTIMQQQKITQQGEKDQKHQFGNLTESQIKEQYARLKKNFSVLTYANMKNMNCKLIGTKIIQKILDFQVDSRVSALSKIFITFNQNPQLERSFSLESFKRNMESIKIIFNKEFIKIWIKNISQIKDIKQKYFSQKIDIILLQLTQFHSTPQLISQSLLIMKRLYDQKNQCIKYFENIFFIESGNFLELQNFIFKRRSKFYSLLKQSTHRATKDVNQGHQYIFNESKDQRQSGIMQDLFLFSELMKNEKGIDKIQTIKSLEESRIYEYLYSEYLFLPMNERQTNNKYYQRIFKSSQIHEFIISYIISCEQIPTSQVSAKLLHLCYIFMTGLIINNQQIKNYMLKYVDIVKTHISANIGAIDFLKQMYDNHKNMLYNESQIRSLTKQICDLIQQLPSQSFYRSKLLDFFRYLIYFNQKSFPTNQIAILKIMEDQDYKNIMIELQPTRLQQLMEQYKNTNFSNENEVIQQLKISPELTYLYTYFQIVSSLIEQNIFVNIQKLKRKYSFNRLIQLVRIADTCWPLSRNLRLFLNKLYYSDQKQIKFNTTQIINQQFDNIFNFLQRYNQLNSQQNHHKSENQYFQNPVRFHYVQTYRYLNLQQILHSLYSLLHKQQTRDMLKDQIKEDNKQKMHKILQQLKSIKKIYMHTKNNYTFNLIKYISSLLKKFLNDQQQINKKIVPQTETNVFPQKLVAILKRIFTKKKEHIVDLNIEANKNMKKVLQFMKLQDQFSKYLSTEFINYIKKFSVINEESVKIYGKIPYISKYQFIRIIIQVNQQNPEVISSDLKIFVLKLVTSFISLRNPKVKQQIQVCTIPIDEWETQDYNDQLSEDNPDSIPKKILQEQNFFKNEGLANFICELLSQNFIENIELANQILLCGIAFLLGGCESSQKAIVEILQADQKNRVFENLEHLITKLGNLIYMNNKKKEVNLDDKEKAFSITTIDTYDYYSTSEKYSFRKNVFQPDDFKELKYKKNCMSAYRRTFKFIQLLCQNNNQENKKFIRQQLTEKGERKLNSINFIQVSTNQLRQLFSILCKQICQIPIFILQFLLQVTQIPIKQNQKALMKSTFFEDLYQMQSFFFNNEQNLRKRDFQSSKISELEQIYSKSIEIILSNFQGNQNQIYKAIDNKLDARFLTDIIDITLNKLGLINKQALKQYKSNFQLLFSPEIGLILNVIIIYKKIKQFEPKGNLVSRYEQFKQKDENKEKKYVIQFFENCLLKIQINYNQKNQSLYFPKHPVFSALSEQLKAQIMNEAPRDSRRDKLVHLYGSLQKVKNNIEHSFFLQKSESINEMKVKGIQSVSSMLTIIITIYMSFTFSIVTQYQQSQFIANKLDRFVVFILSIIQIIFAIYHSYLWYRCRVVEEQPIFYKKVLGVIGDGIQIWLMLLASIVGLRYPELFTIHLLNICTQFQDIQAIIKAIKSKIVHLSLVTCLGVAFVFIFDIITFNNYMKNVYSQQDKLVDMCDNLMLCIIDLYISGVIGQTMEEFEFQRFIYDLIYGVFFGMLFESIISGLMLDAFATERQRNDSMINDQQNNCYICNKSRQDIEKQGDRFQPHTTQNHYLWNYVFYMYILSKKQSSDYTGLEYYIIQGKKKEEVNWFPNSQQIEFDPIQKSEQLIEAIQSKNEQYEVTRQELSKRIMEFNKIFEKK